MIFLLPRSNVFAAWFWAFFDVAFYPGNDSAELIGRQESLGGVFLETLNLFLHLVYPY